MNFFDTLQNEVVAALKAPTDPALLALRYFEGIPMFVEKKGDVRSAVEAAQTSAAVATIAGQPKRGLGMLILTPSGNNAQPDRTEMERVNCDVILTLNVIENIPANTGPNGFGKRAADLVHNSIWFIHKHVERGRRLFVFQDYESVDDPQNNNLMYSVRFKVRRTINGPYTPT